MTVLIAENTDAHLKVIEAGPDDVVLIAGDPSHGAVPVLMTKADILDFAYDIIDALDPEPGYGVTMEDGGQTVVISTPADTHTFNAVHLAEIMEGVIEHGLPFSACAEPADEDAAKWCGECAADQDSAAPAPPLAFYACTAIDAEGYVRTPFGLIKVA